MILSAKKPTHPQTPFSHPGYLSLWEDEKTQGLVAAHETTEGRVHYPFLLRDLRKEPFWRPEVGEAYDIITPYGYGGPEIIPGKEGKEPSPEGKKQLYREFYAEFRQWAEKNKVVSEFVRFSLSSEARPHYYGKVEHNNDNIVVDLSKDPGDAWMGFRHKVRKNVLKALSGGLEVHEDPEGQRLDSFLEVYYDTMQRRQADSSYFLPAEWFKKLRQKMPGYHMFFHAMQGDKVVASELVLYAKERVFSFLGGTLDAYYPLRASDLLKFRIMEWARRNGHKQFVIGGGHKPHDGIFAFKKSFAPNGVMPFYTGKMIFDEKKYLALCGNRNRRGSFFPEYRVRQA